MGNQKLGCGDWRPRSATLCCKSAPLRALSVGRASQAAETAAQFFQFGNRGVWPHWVAGGLGFEPRQPESESGVLPLDDPPSKRGAAPAGTARLDQPPTPCKDG